MYTRTHRHTHAHACLHTHAVYMPAHTTHTLLPIFDRIKIDWLVLYLPLITCTTLILF